MRAYRVTFVWKAGIFSMRCDALVLAEEPGDIERNVREAYPTLAKIERVVPNLPKVIKLAENRVERV